MKCWVCDGLGVTYKSRRSAFPKETCTRCNGTGEIQTNEEWFNTLSTDKKARVLNNIHWDIQNYKDDHIEIENDDLSNFYMAWLKAVHNHED